MLKSLFKSCGLYVYRQVLSDISFEPRTFTNFQSVENQRFYTTYLNSFLTVFSHVNGGVLRRGF